MFRLRSWGSVLSKTFSRRYHGHALNVDVGVGVLRRCVEVVLRCSCAGHGARRRRSQSATRIYCFSIRSCLS